MRSRFNKMFAIESIGNFHRVETVGVRRPKEQLTLFDALERGFLPLHAG